MELFYTCDILSIDPDLEDVGVNTERWTPFSFRLDFVLSYLADDEESVMVRFIDGMEITAKVPFEEFDNIVKTYHKERNNHKINLN